MRLPPGPPCCRRPRRHIRVLVRAGALLLFLLAPLPVAASEEEKKDEDYPHGRFEGECSECHQSGGWTPIKLQPGFDHAKFGFALEGAHAKAACRSCHENLDFTRADSACIDCHQDVHQGELGADCATCHDTTSFSARAEMVRDHQMSRFPLLGAHRVIDCEACHNGARGNLAFAPPLTCDGCHLPLFSLTKNPDHVLLGFPTECGACHTEAGWSRAKFDHGQTTFPLTGAHRAVLCDECHGDGVYAGKDTACYSCHQSNFDGTTDPNHMQAGYSTDCRLCHGTSSWSGTAFDHNQTMFPLTGAHRSLTCSECHGDGVFAGKDTACYSCHQSNFDGTTDPNHAEAGFSTDCTPCHTTSSWSGATFDHSQTMFPLTGAHLALICADCHGDGIYSGKDTACYSCHQASFQMATNPDHVAAAFPTDCSQCHTTSTWVGGQYQHTSWPLTGAHSALTCDDCHGDGVYAGRSSACIACHQADYDGTTDPNHRALGFTTDCLTCHSTASWQGAQFDHDTPYFPIYSGTHAGRWTACSDCHTSPTNYAAFSCLGCHPHSDESKTNGDHSAVSGYSYDSQACYSCHPQGRH